MAVAMVNKFLGFLGMDPQGAETIDNGYVDDDENYNEEPETKSSWGLGKGKVVNMPTNQKISMVISKPTNVEDAIYICDLLRERRSVIINLEFVDNNEGRRIIDVVSGAARVLDGNLEKVSNTILVATPVTYDVANDAAKDDIKNKVSMSFSNI